MLRGWWPWLCLIGCLVAAGLIRAAIPDDIPRQREVTGGQRIQVDSLDAELVEVQTGTQVEWEGSTTTYTSREAIVMVRVRLTAHGESFQPKPTLRSADGYTYTSVEDFSIPRIPAVDVGFPSEQGFVFEVPRDQLGEMTFIMGHQVPDGIVPIPRVARFDVDIQPREGSVVVSQPTVEAQR